MHKYVLDANRYVDASRVAETWKAMVRFTAWAAPRLFLSTVVAAALRAGVRSAQDRRKVERRVLDPFVRRGRVLTPGAAAWDALGLMARIRRVFAFEYVAPYPERARMTTRVPHDA